MTQLLLELGLVFAISAAVLVVTSANAVHAVFFLVLVFIATSVQMFALSMEFRALVFLRVYVGAIAVLFLFVVRRLNVPSLPSIVSRLGYGVITLGVVSLTTILLVVTAGGATVAISSVPSNANDVIASLNSNPAVISLDFASSLDRVSSMAAIGQVLYTNYCVEFLLAGLVLLVAMVGAIRLTLTQTHPLVGQQVHEQHSRDSDRAVFMIS